jgi:hypothetical protein
MDLKSFLDPDSILSSLCHTQYGLNPSGINVTGNTEYGIFWREIQKIGHKINAHCM